MEEISKAGEEELRNARRLLDIKVNEVSIVDRPAIRRKFLIVKRLEEGSMGSFDNSEEVSEEEETEYAVELEKALTDAGFETIDIEKQLPIDLRNALRVGIPWLRKMAGQAEGDVRGALMRILTFLSSVEGGKYPSPKRAKAADKDEDENEKKRRRDKEAEDEKAKEKARHADKSPLPTPKQKAVALDDGDNSSTIIKVDDDGNVHVVTKGAKRLTSNRTAALAEAATKVLGLLKDADEEEFRKAVMSMFSEKELPRDPKFDSLVRPTGAGGVPGTRTQKQDGEGLLHELAERVEKMEKTRAPSTSVDGDQTDSREQVRKSFWSGVL